MAALDLTLSPFALLNVGIRDSKDQVVHAEQDLAFTDECDERSLAEARAALTVARDRLKHELAWLPELSPNRARGVVSQLRNGESAHSVLDGLQGLSRLNLIADLLSRCPGDEELRAHLVDGHASCDLIAARESIEEARRISGFPPITDDAWAGGVRWLTDLHAETLVSDITRSTTGPHELAELISDGHFDPPAAHSFRNAVISRYDRWSEPKLHEISERIDASVSAIRANPDAAGDVKKLDELLDEWDVLSQPVQLNEQAQGLDEPRSMGVFRKLRDLAIWLANEQSRYQSALQISSALHRTFPELPSVVPQLAQDIETLEGLVAQQGEQEILDPLAIALQAAKNEPSKLAFDIEQSGFGRLSQGRAAQLYNAFQTACTRAAELADPDLPWMMVRSVAILLANQSNRPLAALAVVDGIFESGSAASRRRLSEDRKILNKIVLDEKLEQAVQSQDFALALQTISEILALEPPDKQQYLLLQKRLEDNISAKSRRRAGNYVWLAIAIAVIGIVLWGENAELQTDYRRDHTDLGNDMSLDYNPQTDMGLEPDLVPITPPETEGPGPETVPAPGYGARLTQAELRYCQFEAARIDALAGRTPSHAIREFNAKVVHYNDRCRYYQYAPDDLRIVQAELTTSRDLIANQVNQILTGWQGVADSTPAPSTIDRNEGLSLEEDIPVTNPGAPARGRTEPADKPEPDYNWLDSALGDGKPPNEDQ